MNRLGINLLLFLCTSQGFAQQPVNDFTATDVKTSVDISLSQFSSSRGLVIIFTSNECPFDKEYRDRIKILAEQGSRSLPVLLINSHPGPEETADKMKEMLMDWGASAHYLADKSQSAMASLGAVRSPQAFLLKNVSGKFIVIYNGAIDDSPQSVSSVTTSYLQDAIQRFLASQPIETSQTRAVGCSIRRK